MIVNSKTWACFSASTGMGFALALAALSAPASAQNSLLDYVKICNNSPRADDRIRACTAIIESRVGNSDAASSAHNNRGNARAARGEFDLAIRDYNDAVQFDSTNSKAFNNRGVAYRRKGDLIRAINDFSEAISIEPEYTAALANRAATYREKGEYEPALKDLDQAIRLQPAMPILWNERCYIRITIGAPEAALPDCNEAIRLGPNAARYDTRGLAHLKLGRWASAVADYNSALAINSRLATSLYGRGLAKLKAGDATGGKADIAAATQALPTVSNEFSRFGLP